MTTDVSVCPHRTSLANEALAHIRAHAAATYAEECCGALLEREGIVVEAVPLANTTASGAARRFRIGPDEYRQAEARARAQGSTLVGFYHSHPDAPARPSSHDLEQAWPNLTYIIIAVDRGTPGDITSWHLRDDRSAFEKGELICRTVF